MTDPKDWALLLDRYVAGECTAAEEMEVLRRLAESGELRAVVDHLVAARERAAERPGELPASRVGPEAMAKAIARVERRLEDRGSIVPRGRALKLWRAGQGSTPERAVAWWAVRVAASVVVLVGGAAAVRWAGWFAQGQPFREFASARGSRMTITLKDGTTLVLGPASRLRVPAGFGGGERLVELEGEALATVVHDARHPFAVRTSRATVRDVGTTFVVRAYRDDAAERVAVAEGEVGIGDVSLRAHDGAAIDANGRVSVRRGIDLAADLAWTSGGLAFQDTPLRDVIRELVRVYDVEVTVADTALDGTLITASFHDESIDEVLKAVTFAAGARYERTGRSIVIRRAVVPAGRPVSGSSSSMRIAEARGR